MSAWDVTFICLYFQLELNNTINQLITASYEFKNQKSLLHCLEVLVLMFYF